MLHLDWRFFPIYDSVEPGTAFGGGYNAGLVALSVVVATLAAFVALSISGRIVAANSRAARWVWAGAGAIAMGGGIWSMHFIGMLAFSLPCGVTYDPVGTVLSMIPGILASGVALHVISQRTDPGFKRLALGGVLMGAAIGLMHYSGMAAMEPEALLRYDPALVALSLVVAIVLAFLSLGIRFRFGASALSRLAAAALAAPIMGFAVAGMHYTAMQASIFFPLPDAPFASMPTSPLFLAALVTIFVVLIMAIALVATFAGRQVELAQTLAAEIAERKRTEEELIKARQQAEAANRAKSQFLATMSHEIRTPMNGVVGTANLLATTPLNDRQAQLVHNLVRSGQALIGIINDILDLSKIEAGHFDLAQVEFDPRELIAEVTDLFCERCTSKGIEFVYFVTEEVPRRLVGDPSRLRQVLINLVGNAVKFTERGEILIEMSVTESTADRAILHCTVTDTGIGIDREQQARIFESFHQVDASMTRSRGGTGLGLSIVKELVTVMGGDIGVDSEVGRGSCFSFTVRLNRLTGDSGMAAPPRAIDRPLRVLAVDSNAVSAEIMSRYFTSWQLDALICGTAAEAEKEWIAADMAGRPFDVAIIDVKGLRCDGMKLARKIRGAHEGKRAEVILLMGLDGAIDDKKLESVGAFAMLAKPARPSVLFDCLASIASGSRDSGIASFYLRKSEAAPKVSFDARVLVVEDNAVNQDVATGLLKNMGCSVVTASNGQYAVQLFAQESFDLILMDCEMPVMDGFDATRRIRDIERALTGLRGDAARARTPIVALTAHALAEVRERCLEAGMDDFLVKPYDDVQIADMLGRWLMPRAPIPHAAGAESGAEETAAVPGRSATLDLRTIDKIRRIPGEDGTSLFRQVVSRFAENATPLLAEIRLKVRDGDPQAVWRAAHGLRSSATSIGACRVAQSCAEIEAVARENGILPTEAALAALETELETAARELELLAGAEVQPAPAGSVAN
jgi:signal transduction histidine kinase/DNA-binding response OmpR family regulator/HPt (histidine-containing phosphotransfer) domain-containing protein